MIGLSWGKTNREVTTDDLFDVAMLARSSILADEDPLTLERLTTATSEGLITNDAGVRRDRRDIAYRGIGYGVKIKLLTVNEQGVYEVNRK